ncbi:MAG TPA: ClpXP protease specificity-enhancing factor SspB [Xanthobacteraceae bacterium]|nr:ClpXP protease specificity-enhancing factor SspB [Xanthobacteraceae bacterium]
MDYIRYDILTQEALRGVVRTVLADVAAKGLPGDHHFYITFDTHAEGVRISPRLQAQYPQEMTIVLQHQFWDLVVAEDSFEVGLSFKGVPERLVVPFAAIKSFVDPSVQFGLQFAIAEENEPPLLETETEAPQTRESGTEGAKRPGLAAVPEQARPAAKTPAPAEDNPERPGGAEVVSIDRFRKK